MKLINGQTFLLNFQLFFNQCSQINDNIPVSLSHPKTLQDLPRGAVGDAHQVVQQVHLQTQTYYD